MLKLANHFKKQYTDEKIKAMKQILLIGSKNYKFIKITFDFLKQHIEQEITNKDFIHHITTYIDAFDTKSTLKVKKDDYNKFLKEISQIDKKILNIYGKIKSALSDLVKSSKKLKEMPINFKKELIDDMYNYFILSKKNHFYQTLLYASNPEAMTKLQDSFRQADYELIDEVDKEVALEISKNQEQTAYIMLFLKQFPVLLEVFYKLLNATDLLNAGQQKCYNEQLIQEVRESFAEYKKLLSFEEPTLKHITFALKEITEHQAHLINKLNWHAASPQSSTHKVLTGLGYKRTQGQAIPAQVENEVPDSFKDLVKPHDSLPIDCLREQERSAEATTRSLGAYCFLKTPEQNAPSIGRQTQTVYTNSHQFINPSLLIENRTTLQESLRLL